jgi:hypothetical protein
MQLAWPGEPVAQPQLLQPAHTQKQVNVMNCKYIKGENENFTCSNSGSLVSAYHSAALHTTIGVLPILLQADCDILFYPSTPRSFGWSLPFRISYQKFYPFLTSYMCATCPTHFILDLITIRHTEHNVNSPTDVSAIQEENTTAFKHQDQKSHTCSDQERIKPM